MIKKEAILLLTCEHGGNEIPSNYSKLFQKHHSLLQSHRGYDPGALELAEKLAKFFKAQLYFSKTSRLLIELNRSLHHHQLFSMVTKELSVKEKEEVVNSFYLPYRQQVEEFIKKMINKGNSVIHLSIHSFTPELDGIRRKADLAFLYDPSRPREKKFCDEWRKQVKNNFRAYRVRANYPYHGKSDGFTTYLRSLYGDKRYIGVEVEVNQRFPMGDQADWREMQECIVASLDQSIKNGVLL